MAVLIRYVCILVVGALVAIGAMLLCRSDYRHNELMNDQHTEIYREVCETKAKVIENGRKLDILLNIATNSVNGDFR